VEGLSRGRIVRFLTTEEYFSVEVEEMNEVLEEDAETIALMNLCKEALEEYAQYNKKLNQDTVSTLLTLDNPLEFVDRLSALLNLKVEVKQKLLETISVKKRLETVLGHLRGRLRSSKPRLGSGNVLRSRWRSTRGIIISKSR
jgi:ATP-dependent Lon protease